MLEKVTRGGNGNGGGNDMPRRREWLDYNSLYCAKIINVQTHTLSLYIYIYVCCMKMLKSTKYSFLGQLHSCKVGINSNSYAKCCHVNVRLNRSDYFVFTSNSQTIWLLASYFVWKCLCWLNFLNFGFILLRRA